MILRHWLSLAGFGALFFISSLRAANVAGDLVFTMDIPHGLSAAAVSTAVRNAALARDYTIKDAGPDHLVFNQVHHGYDANFTAVFDPKVVKLYSDSYKINGSGVRTEKVVPKKWVQNLKMDITANLDEAPGAGIVGEMALYRDVPAGPGLSQVHDAVRAAAVNREYNITEDKPDRIVLKLVHNFFEANFIVVFDTNSVRLYSDSYEINGDTHVHTRPAVPDRWVKDLDEDITDNLDKAAAMEKTK
jgi:hypothetical protein